jgi:hypothetical protein
MGVRPGKSPGGGLIPINASDFTASVRRFLCHGCQQSV